MHDAAMILTNDANRHPLIVTRSVAQSRCQQRESPRQAAGICQQLSLRRKLGIDLHGTPNGIAQLPCKSLRDLGSGDVLQHQRHRRKIVEHLLQEILKRADVTAQLSRGRGIALAADIDEMVHPLEHVAEHMPNRLNDVRSHDNDLPILTVLRRFICRVRRGIGKPATGYRQLLTYVLVLTDQFACGKRHYPVRPRHPIPRNLWNKAAIRLRVDPRPLPRPVKLFQANSEIGCVCLAN